MEIVIKAENLEKSYGNFKAVDDVSISVKRGEVFGLLGANGAGKTTTIECLLGVKKPDLGSVSVLGLNPHSDRKVLFQKVGVQFQESNYQDKILVREMCEISSSLYRQTVDYKELLNRFGIIDKLTSPVSELSGGQRQRLFIVLALILNPEIVFLDELTTGLDTKARRDVWKCLLNLKNNGMTIFLSSHYMDEVEVLCDRICILKHGRIAYCGIQQEAIDNSPYDNLEDAYLWYSGEEVNEDEII